MLALQMRRLDLEQKAYLFLRELMAEEFMADPPGFVAHFGCRPEDLNGAQLRAFYQAALVEGLHPKTGDELFNKRFAEGKLFG